MNCLKCGKCCFDIAVIPSEFVRIEKKYPELVKKGNLIKSDALVFIKGRCPFLDKNNNCQIYEDRFLVCRTFPIIANVNSEDMMGFTFQCPQVLTLNPSEIRESMQLIQKSFLLTAQLFQKLVAKHGSNADKLINDSLQYLERNNQKGISNIILDYNAFTNIIRSMVNQNVDPKFMYHFLKEKLR